MASSDLQLRHMSAVVARWFERRGFIMAMANPGDHELLRTELGLDAQHHIDVIAFAMSLFSGDSLMEFGLGHPLDDAEDIDRCLARAAAVIGPANAVWLFFPARAWQALSDAERTAAEPRMRQQEVGLLLIDGHTCTKVFDAVDNRYSPNPRPRGGIPF